MNDNFMAPAQNMQNQLQGILQSAVSNQADQRAGLEQRRQQMAEIAKNFEVKATMSKELSDTDLPAALDMLNDGLSGFGASVTMDQYHKAMKGFNVMADLTGEGNHEGALSVLKTMKEKGWVNNIEDQRRAAMMERQNVEGLAEQRSKALMAMQPEHPNIARAREHVSMVQMGQLSPDERIRLTGSTDPEVWEQRLRQDQAMVEGNDLEQKAMQNLLAADPTAFGKASDVTMAHVVNPESRNKIRISNLLMKGPDGRSEDEEKELLGKVQVWMPGSPLAQSLNIKDARREKELNRIQREENSNRITELDEIMAVDGKASADVTSLGAAVQGLGLSTENLQQATKEMGLTPQETALYQRHLNNLGGTGKVRNKDGSISTLYQSSFEVDGKTYNIPTVWDGKILEPDEALKRAKQEGLEQFPSYASEKEAETRYQKMHGYMEKDTGSYIGQHPVDDKTAKQIVLAEGTRAVKGETYKLQVEPRIQDLEKKALMADQQRTALATQAAVALPGQRELLVKRQKELESESTANRASIRLLRDESQFAIAERKSELLMNYTPQGRMDLEKLEAAREKDLKVVQTEQARQRRRETILQGEQTEAERKAEEEERARRGHLLVDTKVDKEGMPLQQAIRESASEVKVTDRGKFAKDVLEARGSGIPEAQMDLLAKMQVFRSQNKREPTSGEVGELARQALKNRPGIKPEDIIGVAKDINKPGVQVSVYDPKQTIPEAGQLANVNQAITEIQDVRKVITNPDGSINRTQLAAGTMGFPFTKGREAYQKLEKAVEIKLRAATGAAAPPNETKQYMSLFAPSNLDSDDAIKYKLDSFENWLQTVADTTDPLGSLRQRAKEMLSEGTVGMLSSPEYKELRSKNPLASASDIVKFLQSRKKAK